MKLDIHNLGGPHGVFSWLSRNRLAPKFGTIPIGYYQQDAINAMEALEDVFGEGADVRAVRGDITDGRSFVSINEVIREASKRSHDFEYRENKHARQAWSQSVVRHKKTKHGATR